MIPEKVRRNGQSGRQRELWLTAIMSEEFVSHNIVVSATAADAFAEIQSADWHPGGCPTRWDSW